MVFLGEGGSLSVAVIKKGGLVFDWQGVACQ